MSERDNIKSGERRTATILFSDMKGFTSLSERLDPEEMDALMTRLFGSFEGVIKSYGGIVEKYIGDALVAVFGVPEVHEDDPSRAIHAALEFLSSVGGELSGVSFRTGIHEGLVTTGKRGEFDVVTGHAMSVAERLESAASPGSILVSEAVKEKCEGDFEFGPRFEIEAKGKTEPIAAFEVRGEAQGAGRDAGPFVGRRELLDEILKAYMRNRYDEVSGFYLSGEAGIGKSRIMQAVVDKIRLFPDFDTPILFARAQKYGRSEFALIVDMLLDCLGLASAADRRQPREAALRALAPYESLPKSSASRFVELVCRLDSEGDCRGGGDAASIAALYDVFDAILVAHSSDLFPILVCIDNASFMDRLSREFFQYLFKNGRIKPFFILAGRDFPSELRKAFQGLRAVKVGAFSREESEALVRAVWPGVEDSSLARIVEAGMGNPLFLREYAAYGAKHRDLSSLPATVQNMFLSSLERYPPEWRELAARLSVFAHSFSIAEASALQAAAGGDIAFVPEALAEFEKDGLVALSGEDYSFRADVFKKALYSSLLNHNKRILHGIIADLLLSRERPNRLRLILHLVRAERYAEAERVMQEDPNRTSDVGLLPYIDILLKRLRSDEQGRVRLLITKSAILFNSGKIAESEATLQRIMRTALSRGDPSLMGYAYHQICNYNAMTYAFQKTVLTGQKALYYYGQAPSSAARSVQNVLRTMALAQIMRNDADEARRLVDRCSSLPGGDPYEALEARAELQLLMGDYSSSLATIEASLQRLPPERRASRFFAYDYKIRALWQLCDFEGIKDAASSLLSLGSLSESSLSQVNAMYAISEAFSGEAESARERFVQAEFYAAQILNDFAKVDALRSLALCRFLSGDAAKAESTALEALTLGLRHSCYWPTFTLLVLLAELEADKGRDKRARFFLVEASYLFASGLLLPSKDLILYYYLASRLLDPNQSERNMAVALRLFEDEKSRLGKEELVANFLSIRSYGKLQAALDAMGGKAPVVPAEDLR